MGTPITLIDSIAERIEGVVEKYRFPESDDARTERAPRVFRQYAPLKKYDDVTDPADYPLVVVALGELDISAASERPTAQVLIVTGGYDATPDNQGWRIPTDIATRIMLDLQDNPVIGPFALEFPLSMNYPDEQPVPQWLTYIYTRWSLPAVERTHPSGIYKGMWGETLPHRKGLM